VPVRHLRALLAEVDGRVRIPATPTPEQRR
jgi:hypothetical protein